MPMDKAIANLKLINDKISDFKIELGRVKDEFTAAITELQKVHLQQATEANDKFSIALFSDVDRTIKYFIKIENLEIVTERINQLITTFELDPGLQINVSSNFDIANFLNIFIPEYGFAKFYKNTKDQILLDFDNFYNSNEAQSALQAQMKKPVSPGVPPISSQQIFTEEELDEEMEEELDEEPEEELEESSEEDKPASKRTKEEALEIERQIEEITSFSDSELISSTETPYDGEYFIRAFTLRKTTSSGFSFKKDFYAPVTPDGKWLATKTDRLLFFANEIRADNRTPSLAVKALDKKPDGFISWRSLGGVPKRAFTLSLPQIGGGDSKRISGEEEESSATRSTIQEALVAHNLNYSSNFFMRQEVSLLKKYNNIEERIKKDLKSTLNLSSILPQEFLKDLEFILFIDKAILPNRLALNTLAVEDFNNFIYDKINSLESSLFKSIAQASLSQKVEIVESERYRLSKEIDDLISACKIRDKIIYNQFISIKNDVLTESSENFDYQSIDKINIQDAFVCNLLANNNSKLGRKLISFTQMICFTSSGYINSFAASMIKEGSAAKGSSTGSSEQILLNENLISQAYQEFSRLLREQVSSKIKQFFTTSGLSSTSDLYCRYIASSIQRSYFYRIAYNNAVKPVRLGWNYISCPTCKKDIYYSKYKDDQTSSGSNIVPLISSGLNITEEKAREFIDPSELSDYNEERFSFFRENGTLITTQELRTASQNFGMTWDDIVRKISSNIPSEHNDGVRLRQDLLRSMGAKKIKQKKGPTSRSVFTYKTKCPFSSSSLPGSIQFAMDASKKPISISDFSCGLSINVDAILDSDTKIEPYELQSGVHDPSVDPEVRLNEAINASIEKGIMSEEDRGRFLEELNRRRSGGWKFSNTMFKCPCKPKFDRNNDKSVFDFAKKYQYLVSPTYGFFTKESFEKGLVYPPTTESGELHDLDDYTASYVVCGDLTSISSFCRDSSDPNSLYGILKNKIKEAVTSSNEQSKLYISNFIDTLLQLGVDFNDILPFIDKIYSEEFKTSISSSHRNILNSIIKVSSITGTEMGVESHDRSMTRAQILGDLKLVCSNGHRFKISDSIRFGQSHIGYQIKKPNSSALAMSLAFDIKKIVTSSGEKNLRESMLVSIPGNRYGQTIISKINKNDIPIHMKNISEWDGKWDSRTGLSEYYYTDGNGNYYLFGDRRTNKKTGVIWGDPDPSKPRSPMPYLKVDPRTNLLVRSIPLEVSDTPTAGKEGGQITTLLDKKVAEGYSSSIDNYIGDSGLIKTVAQGMPKINVYYSPLAVVLQLSLKTIKDLCDRATSTQLTSVVTGEPITLKNEAEIIPIVKNIIGKIYINVASEGSAREKAAAERAKEKVIEEGFEYFDKNYLQNLRVQDLRFLNMLDPSISPIQKDEISRKILLAVTTAAENQIDEEDRGQERYETYFLKNLYTRIYDLELNERIKDLIPPDLESEINKIVEIIRSNITNPKATAISGFAQGEEAQMITRLNTSEFIGRSMMMSSALFLSESVSRLYNKYLDDSGQSYIPNLNIGLDLSRPENIIGTSPSKDTGSLFKISDSDIYSIPTILELEDFFSEDEIEDPDDEEEVSSAVENYIQDFGSYFGEFHAELTEDLERLELACTNQKYAKRGIDLMRESLISKVKIAEAKKAAAVQGVPSQASPASRGKSKSKKETSPEEFAASITTAIIDRCILTPPTTTMSFAAGDKYHAYYAGGESGEAPKGGPFRLLPLFTADVIVPEGLPASAPPIYVLSSAGSNTYNLGVYLSGEKVSADKHIILYKDIAGDFILPFSTLLPEEVEKSGWKTGMVDARKFKVFSKKEISLYHHPFTLGVLSDGAKVRASSDPKIVGFINSYTGFNSLAGFSLGPRSSRVGATALYPTPYAHNDSRDNGGSNIGVFLPLDYGKSEVELKQSYGKIAPFFDANIPVELKSESPGNTIRLNISDFLVRDPPGKAQEILSKISKRYAEYKGLEARAKASAEKKRLRDLCKKEVAELFDIYRHLPYKVTNEPSSTAIQYSGAISSGDTTGSPTLVSARTGYIPMADFVTCYKLIEFEEFSPEFGGHNFWPEGDNDSKAFIKGALEDLIIRTNDLHVLADIMNQQLNDPSYVITANDLLDPHNKLFDKIYQKVREENRGNRSITDEDIRKRAARLIKSITSYDVGEDYVPLSSIISKEVRERLMYELRSDTFWGSPERTNRPKEVHGNFKSWSYTVGSHFPIVGGPVSDNGEPTARIKVVNEIFPFNNEGGEGRVDRLQRIQDPNSAEIISPKDFHYSAFLYGHRHTMDSPYYSGETQEESEKFLREVKKEEAKKTEIIISPVKYASGISHFFSKTLITGLRARIQLEHEEGRDIEADIRSIAPPISKKASVMKNSGFKIRVAPMEAVDNIRRAGMISLLSMFSK